MAISVTGAVPPQESVSVLGLAQLANGSRSLEEHKQCTGLRGGKMSRRSLKNVVLREGNKQSDYRFGKGQGNEMVKVTQTGPSGWLSNIWSVIRSKFSISKEKTTQNWL